MRQWAETSICVDQFHDPSIPIELWHSDWPRETDGLKCRHIRNGQTAQRHFGSRLHITHRPIKGIHVATGNSHDLLAFDLTYPCTHIHPKHPGARKRLHLQCQSCPIQSSSCREWWMDFLCHLRSTNVAHMQECIPTWVFPLALMHLPLKHTRYVTSAFQTEKVNCFLSEDVWRAAGAKSLTFPSLPVALICSHGDLNFSPACSWENVKKTQSQMVFSSKHDGGSGYQSITFSLALKPLMSQDPNYQPCIKMHVCTYIFEALTCTVF